MAAPLNIGVTPALWWRGDLGITTSSGNVSAWASQGSQTASLTQATSGSRPLFVASGQNSQPCVEFDGATIEYLSGTITAIPQPYTVFVVQHRTTSVDLGVGEYAWYADGVFVRHFSYADMDLLAASGGNALYAYGGGTAKPSVLTLRLHNGGAGNADSLRVDGRSVISTADESGRSAGASGGTFGTVDLGTPFVMGADAGAGNAFSGRIYELIVYGSALTDGQLVQVEQYLVDRYALRRRARSGHESLTWSAGMWRGGNRRAAGLDGSMRGRLSTPGSTSRRLEPASRVQAFGHATASGTASATVAPLTATGAGDAGITVTGTATGAVAPLTADGAGDASAEATGTATVSVAPLTASSSGAEEVPATGSADVATVGAAATGAETLSGSGDVAVAPLDAAASGTETIDGSGELALAATSAVGSGAETLSGSATGAVAPLASEGAGDERVDAAGASGVAALSATSSGAEEVTGAASCAVAQLSCEGSGLVAVPVYATGQVSLAPLSATGSGGLEVTGAASCSVAPLGASCAGSADTPVVLATLVAVAASGACLAARAPSGACLDATAASLARVAAVAPSGATLDTTVTTSARLG